MRWLSRSNIKGPAQGVRSLISHDHGRIYSRRLPIYPKATGPLKRGLSNSSRYQTSSESASSTPTQPPTSSKAAQEPKAKGPRWKLLALTFAASAVISYLYGRQSEASEDDVINTITFSAFVITKREQVSPTAFILTLRPRSWVSPQALESGRFDDAPGGFLSDRIQDAWRHGLWSVEIKQPQLQIARHYTPLPPLRSVEASGDGNANGSPEKAHDVPDEQADLRFLIRRMDGGEMTNYLSRQRVGDTIWLRGPHLGFDIPRRLGVVDHHHDESSVDDNGDNKNVVFLAGGTGIAPALQIAHWLLDSHDSSGRTQSKPRVSILWANRLRADALGREQVPSEHQKPGKWSWFWTQTGATEPQGNVDTEPTSSLSMQIEDLKRRYPSQFEVSYFVDSEGSFISASDLRTACSTKLSPRPSTGIDKDCTWHSAIAVEHLPDNNDAARSASPCTCAPKATTTPGANLLCVSGPDGFIEAYAGAKRWHDGGEMQGGIGGLVGRVLKEQGSRIGEWLVLKL